MGTCKSKFNNENEKMNNLNSSRYIRKRISDINKLIPNRVAQNNNKIEDEYKIRRISLGSGSFGDVKKGIHIETNEIRAIKIIPKTYNFSDEQKNLIKEIIIMKKLDHPNIVKIFEFFEDQDFIYIIMEFLEGGELFNMLKTKKTFSEKESAEILKNILEGINYLHSKDIIHRDLKPENILFTKNGILKIVDFGSSTVIKSKRKIKQYGTPYYVAPEVLRGKYGTKCDIWSCGVILYSLLSGFPPFNGDCEREILQSVKRGKFSFDTCEFEFVSDQARDIICKMLEKNVKKRISAEECLKHPFFNVLEGNKEDLEVEKYFLNNLKNFSVKNILQRVSFYFLVNCLNFHDKKVMEIFKSIDKNNDGVISKQELLDSFKKCHIQISNFEIENIFKTLDTHKKGTIDYTEFLAGVIDKEKIMNEKKIKTCFNYFDRDKSGKIKPFELKEIFQGDQVVDEKIWKELISQGDFKKDGSIDFDEFKQLLLL